MVGIDVRHLGEYIREQRAASDISLRQLAKLAGVSNPYLSQIERGLRKPSAEILQQIAKALRISAEALYVQAGILEQREGSGLLADAIHADDGLNERQKQVLLEIYDSFRKENTAAGPAAAQDASVSLVTASSEIPPDLSTTPIASGPSTRGRATKKAAAAKAAASGADPTAGKRSRAPRRRPPAEAAPASEDAV